MLRFDSTTTLATKAKVKNLEKDDENIFFGGKKSFFVPLKGIKLFVLIKEEDYGEQILPSNFELD